MRRAAALIGVLGAVVVPLLAAAPAGATGHTMNCYYNTNFGRTWVHCSLDQDGGDGAASTWLLNGTYGAGGADDGNSGQQASAFFDQGEFTATSLSVTRNGTTYTTGTISYSGATTYPSGYPTAPTAPTTTTTAPPTTTTTAPPTTTTTSGGGGGGGTTTTTAGTDEVALIASAGASAKDTLLLIAGGALLIGAAVYGLSVGWRTFKRYAA